MVKKRERLEVIHDVLAAVASSNNSIRGTRLLYASNLSPQMYKDYLKELMDKGFIMLIEVKKKKTYSLTKKGFEFLEEYKTIRQFIQNFGL